MRPTPVLLALALACAAPAWAQDFKAAIYPQGGARTQPLYTQTQVEQRQGDTVLSAHRVYLDSAGKEVAVEDVAYENGKVKSLTLDQRQLNEQGKVEVTGGRLVFTYTAGGQTTTDSESASADLVVSPTLVPYLAAHWEALLRGDTVKARFAVLDRKETVGFQFTKIGETQANGRAVVLVQMKPSSFILAALVKSIRLVFDKESRRLVEYSGRVVPRRKDGDKWETLDADVVYTY